MQFAKKTALIIEYLYSLSIIKKYRPVFNRVTGTIHI